MLKLKGIDHNVLNAKQHQREAEIVAEAGKPGKVTIATNMAGRGTDIKISEEVRKAGGLAIIGTERHESRRIDRQLRGRSGRQGDPGTSQFYVSLEDRLMRLFGSERMASWMDKLGHQEGEVIQHSMVTKSIERAQKKVEENNFGIRKRLLEYDDVMNIQREAIYKKRRNALYGERLSVDINNMFFTLVEGVVFNSKQQGSLELLKRSMLETMGYVPEIDEQEFRTTQAEALADTVLHQFQQFYQHKFSQIIDMVMPQIRDVHATQSHRYKRILLPFTDGSSHPLPISADLTKAVQTNGRSIIQDVEQVVTLLIIDDKWKEHLRNMDELKESVQAASFEQKDPLVVYKMEAYNLFEQLVLEINQEVTAYLSKCNIAVQAEERQIRQAREVKTDMSKSQLHHGQEEERRAAEAVSQAARQETIRRMEAKVGRNDLCPCGSGKKYKHCHGR